MAFQHETDVALDVPDFFANLEALLVAAGWTHVSGTGTTTIVYSSSGEVGTLTKLYIKIWRDGPNPERVYFCVQDDAGGTHATTTGNVSHVEAPALGAIAFKYWITATKDFLVFAFRSGEGYTGCYVGILEPFAATTPDQTMYIVSVGLLNGQARVLQRYNGTWDYLCITGQCTSQYNPHDLDSSHPIFGAYVYNASDRRENYGQMLYCGGGISAGTGINPEDTIASGYPGASSEWVIVGTEGGRRAIATSEPLPAGVGDGANWGYTSGVAADRNALQPALEAFLTPKGWLIADWPDPECAIDRSFSSAGENGLETIVLRWQFSNTNVWGPQAYDAIGGEHHTFRYGPGGKPLYSGDFPLAYYFTGDKDCFLAVVYVDGDYRWLWCGCCKSFFPDPTVIDSVYMVGIGCNNATDSKQCLRSPSGAWVGGMYEFIDPGYDNSSPSLIDGATFVVWPYPVYAAGAANYVPWGTFQYLHRMSSAGLSVRDTVQVGGHMFMYIGDELGIKIA